MHIENPIKEWRKKNKVTQIRLARKIGVSLHTVQLWEGGGCFPSKEHLKKLESVGIPIDKLKEWREKL